MQLVPASQYRDALLKKIPLAKRRIVLAAMIITWGKITGEILLLIEEALSRGVEVTLLSDGYYSRLPIAYNEFWTGPQTSQRRPKTNKVLERLYQKGARVLYTRTTGRSPYKGAYHAKITIIDNDIYTFGGVNFNDEAFSLTDYMLHEYSNDVADMLVNLVEASASHRVPNVTFAAGRTNIVLFDGGHKGKSVIYGRACALSNNAQRIWYVSQMCPSGKLAGLLRRTENYCYFNRPIQSIGPNGAAIAVDQTRYRIRNLYKGTSYIHAKFMLFEYPDGAKKLLSGSHNFSWRGVRYGTAEIALESSDAALWDQLTAFMRQEVT